MNILYIDHYAGAKKLGRSFRPYYLGQEWTKSNCHLTVIGGSYSHLRKINPEPGICYIDNIRYIWLWTPKYKGNGIGRIISMLVFMFQLFINTPKIIRLVNPDAIIASTVYMLDIFPAWLIKKCMQNSPKIIFELHDIWPMSPMQIGKMSKYNPYIFFLGLVERSVYKICDKVASILPNSFDHIKKFGLNENQVFYVPNGIVVDEWENEIIDKNIPVLKSYLQIIKDLKDNGVFLLGYAGAHSIANELYNLVDAAKLVGSQNVHIVLIGDGNEKLSLQNYAKTNEITNITFLEPVEKDIIPEILKQFDALYIGLHNLSVFQYGISPNKIFDYMMSGRPIISAINTPCNPVEIAGCGFLVAPEDSKELANIIIEVSKQPKSKLDEMGIAGKKFVIEHHSYTNIAKLFLEGI